VTVLGFARFEVAGSRGDRYTVQFLKDEGGEFVVKCECKGNKRGLACYHAAAVSSIFKLQVTTRAAEKAAHLVPAPAPAPVVEEDLWAAPPCSCGKEIEEGWPGDQCIDCSWESGKARVGVAGATSGLADLVNYGGLPAGSPALVEASRRLSVERDRADLFG
jgi:hypothetical protein